MRRWLWLSPGILALAGCGAAYESQQVTRRFQQVFACPDPHVRSEAGGYLVEGCGRVAHFRCIDADGDDDVDEGFDEHGLVGALAELHTSDTCLMEHVEAPRALTPAAPTVARRRAPSGHEALAARLLLTGGHLSLRAIPGRDPEHVLVGVYSIAELAPGECRAELYHDGERVPVLELERTGDHQARLAIPVAALHDVDRAVRFAGAVCGYEFALDAGGLRAAGEFEARFREELARASAQKP